MNRFPAIIIALFFTSWQAVAQADSLELKNNVQRLDKALISKDSAMLDLLLDKKLSYGHSNGWIQSKEDVWTDFKTGKVSYKSISNSLVQVLSIGKEWATVKIHTKIHGARDGKDFEFTLHVMQVWRKDKKGWQLLARQSTRL